ncbi:class I SAM-dependent methyltransferase [Candidatus Falkowbacteria bacterium]|nr:class I SAM-dependent methyltransferase [Candidatus Falkowbacteria bacterium]
MTNENGDSVLKILNSFFDLNKRPIWIYGAGFMGGRLQSALQSELNVQIQGFIDQNAQNCHLDKIKIVRFEEFRKESVNRSNQCLIVIASRHWEEISQALIASGLSEPQDFIEIGLYCESYSPIEFDWYFDNYYYNAFKPIRKNGMATVNDLGELALYDYFSSRRGQFILEEGKYLEKAVMATKGKKILELGPACGKSTHFLAKGVLKNNGGSVTSVDTFGWEGIAIEEKFAQTYGESFYDEFIKNISFNSEYKAVIIPQKMLYQDFLRDNKEIYDFAFIDLFHTYDEIMEIFQHIQPHLNNGAPIIFHDYSQGWPGEVKAIDELIEKRILELVNQNLPGSIDFSQLD